MFTCKHIVLKNNKQEPFDEANWLNLFDWALSLSLSLSLSLFSVYVFEKSSEKQIKINKREKFIFPQVLYFSLTMQINIINII